MRFYPKFLNRVVTAFASGVLLTNVCSGESKIRIGVSLPLSGGAAAEGDDLRKILTFANEQLAGNHYEFIFEDDKCDNKEAVSAAQKLSAVDKVSYVFGYACSGGLVSAAPIFEKSKIVTIGLATGAPEISNAGDYIFRTIPSLEVAGRRLAQHAAKKFHKIALLSEETAYCQGLADAFVRHAPGATLRIDRHDYLPETADFRTLLLKMRASGNEAVFLNPQDEKGMIILYRQLRDSGWKVPVYAAYYPGFSEFLQTFGDHADGIVYADLPFIGSGLNADGVKLFDEYVARYGRPQSSEFYFVTALSAFTALHEAITSKEPVKDFLYSHNFPGVFGDFSFDKKGDVTGEKLTFVLKTIKEGAPTAIDF